MAKRRAFTLIELIIAIMIFSYMTASLVTIYGTSHRHMSQNYRSDVIKTNTIVAMRAIQNNLLAATRIDFPAAGAAGNTLAFAVNVDKDNPATPANDGCYPLSRDAGASWHYFCVANDPLTPGYRSLYYHTDAIAPGLNPCGSAVPSIWDGIYPVPVCGVKTGTQQMYKLIQYVDLALGRPLFSRRAAEGVNDANSVWVGLATFWPAAAPGLGGAQRDIRFDLTTVISGNMAR